MELTSIIIRLPFTGLNTLNSNYMTTKNVVIVTVQIIIVMLSVCWALISIGSLLFPADVGKGIIGGISGVTAHFIARWIVKIPK